MNNNNYKDLDKKCIVANNPMIDKTLVTSYEKIEIELKAVGIVIKPEFNIAPPLGGKKLMLCNSSR